MWSWFATDFAYYGLALNSTNLLSLDTGDSWGNLRQVSLSSLIAVGGLIPGSIVSLFLIDTVSDPAVLPIIGFVPTEMLYCCSGVERTYNIRASPP